MGGLIVLMCVLTVVGLSIADWVADHVLSRELLAALVFIILTFSGYGADRLLERFKP